MFSRFTPPDSFHLGSIQIYYYSLVVLVATWVTYGLITRAAKLRQINEGLATDALVIAFVCGIIGARIAYISQNTAFYQAHAESILMFQTGGLSIHGGLIGVLIALYGFSRFKKIHFFSLTDLFATPLLIAQMIGRVGNYFNQELFGYPTNLPWRILIDPNHRPAEYPLNAYFHPTFFYEIVLDSLGLLVISRLKLKKEGQVTFAILLVFGISRFITEIFRISPRLIADLSLAQIISLIIIVLSIIGLKAVSRTTGKDSLNKQKGLSSIKA